VRNERKHEAEDVQHHHYNGKNKAEILYYNVRHDAPMRGFEERRNAPKAPPE
jgi:hypothetical protein